MKARERRWIVVAGCLVALFLVVAAVLAKSGALWDRQGQVSVPYNAGEVYKVRVLDAVTIYADGSSQVSWTVLGSISLIVLATAAFMTALVLRIAGSQRRLAAFYGLMAIGLGYAGLDKLLGIHETVGHNLRFLADIPGVDRPDDFLLLLYLVPLGAFAYMYRDYFRADRRVAVALASGVVLFALAALGDLTSSSFEKPLELLSGLCMATGLLLLFRFHLVQNLRPRVEPVDVITAREGPERARLAPERAAAQN